MKTQKNNKRANGEGSIYYEKSRERWVCSIVDPSGKRVIKRFKTEQEAKDYLIVVKSSIITNDYIQPSQITFGQWLIDYLKLYVFKNASSSTIKTYTNYCTYAEPLNAMPIQKLTTNNLQNLINNLPDTLSPTTHNGIARLFKRALNKAYETKIISYNPMQGVIIPKIIKTDIETFTIEEMKSIFKYLSNVPYRSRDYAIIKIAFATGMRIGEILALQNTDIYPTYINVSKSVKKDLNEKLTLGTTKNKKSRQITVPPSIIALLKSLIPNKNGFLFYTRSKNLIFESNMQSNWKTILKRCNIEYKKLHAIRHTHATQLLENGVSITEVSKRLGHSNITITLNTYSHVLRDKNRQNFVTDKVAEIFDF